jgi:sulfite exporter TauE/SafE
MALVAAAFLAGLAGSPHCIAMCGAFAVACGGRVPDTLAWHLGRITTYMILGAVAGSLGWAMPGPGWVGAVASTLLVVYFAAVLAGLVPEPRVRLPGLAALTTRTLQRGGFVGRYAFGLANGLLPCGLVYAALGMAVAASGPAVGALVMMAFGLGTAPLLTAVSMGLKRTLSKSIWGRRLVAFAVLVAGLWAIASRTGWLGGGGHMDAQGPAVESVH